MTVTEKSLLKNAPLTRPDNWDEIVARANSFPDGSVTAGRQSALNTLADLPCSNEAHLPRQQHSLDTCAAVEAEPAKVK